MKPKRDIKLHHIQIGMRLSKKKEIAPKSNFQPTEEGALEKVVDEELESHLQSLFKLENGKLVISKDDFKHLDFSIKYNQDFNQNNLNIKNHQDNKVISIKSTLLQSLFKIFNKSENSQ